MSAIALLPPLDVPTLYAMKARSLTAERLKWKYMNIELPERGEQTWELCSDHESFPLIFNEIKRNLGYPVISLCRIRAWGHGYIGYDPEMYSLRSLNALDIQMCSNVMEELAVLKYLCGMNTSAHNFKMCMIEGVWRPISLEIGPSQNPKISIPKFTKATGAYRNVLRRIIRRLQLPDYDALDTRLRYVISSACEIYDSYAMYSSYNQRIGKVINRANNEEDLLKQYEEDPIQNSDDESC